MRYGAPRTRSPLHRSVSQTVVLPEDVEVSRLTTSVLPPPSLRVICSAGGLNSVVDILRGLRREMFDSYRPELHYMRGPGPRWREKHSHSTAVLPILR